MNAPISSSNRGNLVDIRLRQEQGTIEDANIGSRMKRFLCCGIVAASMVAAYVYHPAKQPVYSLNICSGGWTYNSVFQIGSSPCSLGVCVRSAVGFSVEPLKREEIKSYTDFELAGRVFTLSGDLSNWVRGTGYALATFGLTCGLLMFITPRPKPE